MSRLIKNMVFLVVFLSVQSAFADDGVVVLKFRAGPGLSPKTVAEVEANVILQLRKAGIARVLNVARVEQAMLEAGFNDTICITDRCLADICRILGVGWVVMGDLGKVEGRYRLNMVLWSAARSGVVEYYSKESRTISFSSFMSDAAVKFANAAIDESGLIEADVKGKKKPGSVGIVAIETKPLGAKVWLDADLVGRTPTTLYNVETGEHSITLELGGHQTLQVQVEVRDGEITKVDEVLLMRTGGILIETEPSGAQVFINGKIAGKTPFKAAGLIAGKHEIAIAMPGYSRFGSVVEIESNVTLKRKIVLKPATARLLVSSEPSGAMIFVNGSGVGRTLQVVELDAGSHSLRVYQNGYEDENARVTLKPGESFALHFRMRKSGVADNGPPTLNPVPVPRVDEYDSAAVNLYNEAVEQGDMKKREELLRKAVKADPKFLPAHNMLGTMYMQMGRYDDAKRKFKTAISINPDYPDAHKNLGFLYIETGRIEDALVELKRAVALNPGDSEAVALMARVFAETGNFPEAVALVERAVGLNPKTGNAFLQIGKAYLKTGNVEGAVVAYLKCLDMDPSMSVAYYELGLAYEEKGESSSAIYYFKKYVAEVEKNGAGNKVDSAKKHIAELGGSF